VHERFGVGLVRKWHEKPEKWEVVFFGHHHVRDAAASLHTLDENAIAGLEAHRFSTVMAQRKLLLVPFQWFRMVAMEAFQSMPYQCFVTLCVFGNTIALSAYHFDIDVFTANYVQALHDHCGSVLPGLAQAAFLDRGNYTRLWDWRRAVQSSSNISAACTDFFVTGGSALPAMPPYWETTLDWTNNAFSIFFLFDLVLGLVGAVSTQPKAQLRATADAVVSVLTVIGIGIPFFSLFAVLRLFTCVFRLVKLFRMRHLERMLSGIGDAISAIIPLLLLVCLFVFFFAILGVQFFGRSSRPFFSDDGVLLPIPNWASMWPNEWGYGAVVTVMQVLCSDNWNVIMFQLMTDVSPAALVYFVVVFCFGACVPSGLEPRVRTVAKRLCTGIFK
jgi:hypothetical protein